MTSLARRHRERVSAALLANAFGTVLTAGIAPAIDQANPSANDYRALLASLHEDIRQISDIHSHDARKPLKLEKSATYRTWVEGALAAGDAGEATQDEIVAEMLVWAVDTADYDWALKIAAHMLAHGVSMPERFPSASVAAFIANKISEAALVAGADVSLTVLQSVNALTSGHDMHDDKRAKVMKAMSRAFAKTAEAYDAAADNAVAGGKSGLTAAALDCATRALELDKNAGVKKDIEQLTRKLADLGGPPPVDQTEKEQKPEGESENTAEGADANATG